jgi:cytochrome c2
MSCRAIRIVFPCIAAAAGITLLSVTFDPAAAADPVAGKAVFQSVCSICHSAQGGQNKIGPSLFGVVGRKTGSEPGYNYSPANKDANLTWDEATLDKYLEAPRTVMPGTKMTYAGLKDAGKRADLIAYLATLK